MQFARVFQSGNSQTIRLPREYRFDEQEVRIARLGSAVLLFPKHHHSEDLLALLELIGPVEIEREQPEDADLRRR